MNFLLHNMNFNGHGMLILFLCIIVFILGTTTGFDYGITTGECNKKIAIQKEAVIKGAAVYITNREGEESEFCWLVGGTNVVECKESK
jgi:hypothetical protein